MRSSAEDALTVTIGFPTPFGAGLRLLDAPAPEFDSTSARRLLTNLGLTDSDHRSTLGDRRGEPARFSLLTEKGNTSLERGAAVLRDNFASVDLQVDVVPLEVGSLIGRVMRGDYDAACFSLVTTDSDPSLNLDFLLTSGGAHIWNPSSASPRPRGRRRSIG